MIKRICIFFFFFSSRRRHTRSLRDWSSDVCSSDLPVAINAVAVLGHHDPETAYRALVGLLTDRESRAWHAAGESLVKLADPRAVEALHSLEESKRDERDKQQVRKWIEALSKPAPTATGS